LEELRGSLGDLLGAREGWRELEGREVEVG